MDASSSTSPQNDENATHSAEDKNTWRYKKIQGSATTEGQMYECKTAALLFLRGLNSGLVFELAVNVADAGAMDDIVFRFKSREEPDEWVTCFIQVKHKNNSTLTISQLTAEKGNFSLPIYLKAYGEVKSSLSGATKYSLFDGKIENSWFILFTNSKYTDKLGQGSGCDKKAEGVEKFLWTNKGKIFSNSKEKGEFAKDISECLEKKGVDGKIFLSRLKLFCGQPNQKDLDSLIIDELRVSKKVSNRASDVAILFRFFIAGIKAWWEDTGKGTILHRDSNLLQVANDKTLVEVCSLCEGVAYQMPSQIKYSEAVISELRNTVLEGHNFVHFIPSEPSFKLSCTKVIQAVEKEEYNFFGIESMIRYRQQVLKEWKNANRKSKTLIILMNNSENINEEITLPFFIEVCNLDAACVVFVADENDSLVNKIIKEIVRGSYSKFHDNFHASQLEEKSLKYISCEISFKLQGYWTKLGNFSEMSNQLVNENQNLATLGLDGRLLVDIIESGTRFSVGAPLPDSIKYYVARTMDQLTVIKKNIFNVLSLTESIAIRQATIKYVRSILEKSADPGQVKESLETYSHSLLSQDSHNNEIFVGTDFTLGRFVCNFIGFQTQYDQANPIPALRLQLVNSKNRDQESLLKLKWFLCIFDHCKGLEEPLLLKHHEVKHILRLDNELLTWTDSVGDIDVIRRHIDESLVIPTVNPETATCVDDRRVVLLCAEPGIGKSTLMTRLAKKTKETHPNLWIILISLNDHINLFADGKHNDALGFLLAASGIHNKAEVHLFEIALLTTGNVVVLLDGYDEIAPKYITECCALLTNLINYTKAHKIWITSRNSLKGMLEAHLSTLAANLRKFNEDDQRRFLKQYWGDISIMSESGLDAFISNFIKITSQTIRDQEKDFMGIPLQTQIMADVFEEYVTQPPVPETVSPELPTKLDLLDLLGKFVDKKLKLYCETKLKMNKNNAGYDQFVSDLNTKKLYEGHKFASLILILSDHEIKKLHSKTIYEDSASFFEAIKSSADKTGIIDGVINEKPRFVHRVFAEFFLAQWFAEHFKENVNFLKNKLFTPEYAVILNFFDRILAKKHFLHTAVLDANLAEVKRLLNEGFDVNANDDGGRTALHLAATLGSSKNKSLKDANMKILELLMKKSPVENLNLKDTIMLRTPLRYADDSEWWLAVDKLMAVSSNPKDDEQYLAKTKLKINDGAILGAIVTDDLVKLLNFCLKRGLTFDSNTLISASEHGSYNVASILIKKGVDFAD